MKMCRNKIIVVAIVFVLSYVASKVVFKTMGPHTWHRAQVQLGRLKTCVDVYYEERGEYPSEKMVNDWLSYIWISEGDIDRASDNDEFESLSMIFSDTSYFHLKRWGRPTYIVSDSIPDGRGFYSVGDDGMTSSHGNDPDDINSWDTESISYYHRRLWRNREIRDIAVSLGISLLVFAAFKIKWIA